MRTRERKRSRFKDVELAVIVCWSVAPELKNSEARGEEMVSVGLRGLALRRGGLVIGE
jgi:hypothetical protein